MRTLGHPRAGISRAYLAPYHARNATAYSPRKNAVAVPRFAGVSRPEISTAYPPPKHAVARTAQNAAAVGYGMTLSSPGDLAWIDATF